MNKKPRKIEIDPNALTVRKIGNSVGFIIPKEMLASLKWSEGDKIYVAEMPDGSIHLTPRDPHFSKGMASAEKAIRRYRNALSELAK